MAKKENRRTQRTRRKIKNALLELKQQKTFEQISITDICETAGLNRTTFYLHYSNLDALLREIEQDAYDDIERYIRSVHSNDDKIRQIALLLDYIRNNLPLYRMLLQSPEGGFKNRFMRHFLEIVSEDKKDAADPADAAYAQAFILSGCTGMIVSWIGDDFRVSSAELAELLYKLCDGASKAQYKGA